MDNNSTVKDFARQITQGYTSAINRLRKKYESLSAAADAKYNQRGREISRENVEAKNSTSANHRVSLANSQKSLLERGLASSGAAVGTELRANLSRNAAFAELDAEAKRAHSENELARISEKSRLASALADSENDLYSKMGEALREQANLDREYEADRADAAEDTRRWEAENALKVAESEHKRELDKSKLHMSAAQQAFENALAKKKLRLDEEQRETDNAMSEKKLALDEKKLALDEKKHELDSYEVSLAYSSREDSEPSKGTGTSSTSASSSGKQKTTAVKSGTVPEYDADDLVEKIYDLYSGRDYYRASDMYDDIEHAIYQILNDTTLDPSYKVQVRVYATAMGYI